MALTDQIFPWYVKTTQGMNNKVEDLELGDKFVTKAQNCRFEEEPGAVRPPAKVNRAVLTEVVTTREELEAVADHWDDLLVESQADSIFLTWEWVSTWLETVYPEAPLLVIKDPRTCRLMKFWLELLGRMKIEPIVLFITRNPLEVAFSLKERDGIPLEQSMLLWLRHVLEAEYYSRRLPRGFLSFHNLLRDWKSCLLCASKQAGVIWPRLHTP